MVLARNATMNIEWISVSTQLPEFNEPRVRETLEEKVLYYHSNQVMAVVTDFGEEFFIVLGVFAFPRIHSKGHAIHNEAVFILDMNNYIEHNSNFAKPYFALDSEQFDREIYSGSGPSEFSGIILCWAVMPSIPENLEEQQSSIVPNLPTTDKAKIAEVEARNVRFSYYMLN